MKQAHKNIGDNFDDFLEEEGILNEVESAACKKVIAWQIEQEMKARNLSKTEMAKKMNTSRVSLDRLLDPTDNSVTLSTLVHAADVLEKRLIIGLR